MDFYLIIYYLYSFVFSTLYLGCCNPDRWDLMATTVERIVVSGHSVVVMLDPHWTIPIWRCIIRRIIDYIILYYPRFWKMESQWNSWKPLETTHSHRGTFFGATWSNWKPWYAEKGELNEGKQPGLFLSDVSMEDLLAEKKGWKRSFQQSCGREVEQTCFFFSK